jgi:hypothetical protein
MTRARLHMFATLLLCAIGLGWAGCANETDSSLNRLPSSSKPDVVADTTPDTGPVGTCDCATVGDWYRFTVLAIDTLAGEENLLLPLLNGIWAKDIAAYGLNILVEVTEVTATEVRLRAVSGARVGGRDSEEVCVLPGTEFDVVHPRAGCELQGSQPTGINVYAGSTDRVKNCAPGLAPIHAIPARDLVLAATVSNDCGSLTSGKVVSGVITEQALDAVCSCLKDDAEDCSAIDPGYADTGKHCIGCAKDFQHLKGLLQSAGQISEFACTSAGGEPALCITAHFEAVRMETSPSPCP